MIAQHFIARQRLYFYLHFQLLLYNIYNTNYI